MATTKTLTPTGAVMSMPAMADRPDISVVSDALDKTGNAINTNASDISDVNGALAIVATGNTAPQAITTGQYVIWGGDLYTASTNISSGATLSSSNLTAVSGGGLNSLNSNIASLGVPVDYSSNLTGTNCTITNCDLARVGYIVSLSLVFTPTNTSNVKISGFPHTKTNRLFVSAFDADTSGFVEMRLGVEGELVLKNGSTMTVGSSYRVMTTYLSRDN